jgi:D-glycero-alpha-D-manno-heptose-7-phosphate kinase
MIIRSKAPFRIGLAGGGSDVSPYSDIYGGAVLNAAISLYAKTTIIPTRDNQIIFESVDKHFKFQFDSLASLEIKEEIALQIGVYNHMVKHYSKRPLSFKMITEMDVPTGSGLGTSSTLVVSIIGAFCRWLKINLSPTEIAQKAFQIERIELGMAGGKQDQYAAALGGFNFLEFGEEVSIEHLTIVHELSNELEFNLILYYNKVKR